MELLKRLGDAWMYVVDHKDVALALVAIVMSSISLGWQVITWRRGGSVVEVSVVPTAAGTKPEGELFTGVRATNTGRGGVTVTGWGLRLPDGYTVQRISRSPISDPLPRRLESEDHGTWHIETEELRRLCIEHGTTEWRVRAFVHLGNGRTIYARKRGIGIAKEKQAAK